MPAPPRLSIHIGDYLKNTPPINATSWEHHGIYFAALVIAWNVPGCRLPVDKLWMAGRFGCSVEVYEQKVEPVIAEYFKKRGAFWYQKRLTEEHSFTLKNSKRQSQNAKSMWNKRKDKSHGIANYVPDLSHGNTPPAPTPSTKNGIGKSEDSKFHGIEKGRQRTTIKDPAERLARFQDKLAKALGRDGSSIVAAAFDRNNPLHARSLRLCKDAADRMHKRWPTQAKV